MSMLLFKTDWFIIIDYYTIKQKEKFEQQKKKCEIKLWIVKSFLRIERRKKEKKMYFFNYTSPSNARFEDIKKLTKCRFKVLI